MSQKVITLHGVRTHNLQNISIKLPRDKLVVITGPSGSGKSSLAFDTLYAEGQRRYVESLSTYARQFLSVMPKPDIDYIDGLSPAIAIEQKATSHNPRSTVGTITEIYDYLRLLFARAGRPSCPQHGGSLEAQTVGQMVDAVLNLPADTRIMLLAPVIRERKGEYQSLLQQFQADGYVRVELDGVIYDLDSVPELKKNTRHSLSVVIDRLKVKPEHRQRMADSIETALKLSDGLLQVVCMDEVLQVSAAAKGKKSSPEAKNKTNRLTFSARYSCIECDYSLPDLEPRLFSFNNPAGACSTCDGLGMMQFMDPDKVVVNAELSLSEGAIRGWDQRNHYYYSLLSCLAEHYNIPLDKPFAKLSKKIQDILLYGSGKEKIVFAYRSHHGRRRRRTEAFEGVIPAMQRRYAETGSEAVQQELAKYLSTKPCVSCDGSRVCEAARHVFIDKKNIGGIVSLTISQAHEFFEAVQLTGHRAKIAESIFKEIKARLKFLLNVGLDYLTLQRSAETLSGGEAQRIRLASQVGSGLVGVMYVLDEPSIGLHQRDNMRLISTLNHLRDLGNTVIVIEHDEEAMLAADHIVDVGPGAGKHGGQIVFAGSPQQILQDKTSITGQFLSGRQKIAVPAKRRAVNPAQMLFLEGASANNLKNVDLKIPLGLFTCITGVSGSGKSSLINATLYPLAARRLNRAHQISPGPYVDIHGLEYLDKVIAIDQSPIGRTPRSNPATYTGILTPIRELFAGTEEARIRGYAPGRFSFNVRGGRCEACEGDGHIKVEMHFLPDVYVACDQCHGLRYNRETLEVKYKNKNIHDILSMTVEEALAFFTAIPALKRRLQTLLDVGLGYINLGQSATTLSGGEAQRIKLARELSKRDTGSTLYLLDEPTTGLHFTDIKQLLAVLVQLRDRGNSIVVIEHNLDVIKTADWIVDIGPEGGSGGGTIVVAGTPEKVARCAGSHTGKFLKKLLHQDHSG